MAIPNLHAFLDSVLDLLFEPEGRRLDAIVTELDAANRELRGLTVMGFMHNGQVYIPKAAKTRQLKGYPALSFSLTNRAAEWDRDMRQVGEDKQFIKQILWLLTKDCDTTADVRDALPESFVSLVPSMADTPRTREDGYTVKHDERLYGQYLKIRDKIDVYWACRMVY
ncbi:hypothetical protein D3C85_469190 [compost metagenome]